MLEIDVLPRLRRPVDRLLHPGSVFGVNPLEDTFDGRCGRAVVLEDSKGLVRPDDLAGGRLPPEASRMAEPLRFREVRLAPLLGTQVGGEDVRGRETRRADGLVGARCSGRSRSSLFCRRALWPPCAAATLFVKPRPFGADG